MRKHAATLVLLALAIALGVWLWLSRDTVSEGERKRREGSVFSAWRREELSRVEIAHEGETLVLTRDAKRDAPWRMTSPRADRCDQAAVERLLTSLEFATVKRKATDDGALGLDAPRASGSVTMGGLVLRFALGAPSPRPEGSAYLRVEGEAPVVVSQEVAQALLDGSDKYRDRTVVPYLSIELARFQVKRPDGGLTLERIDTRAFRDAETGVLASRDAIDRVWAALAEMRAESFPKDADADRLTASPRVTIVMTPKDATKPPAELVVGDPCPGQPDDVVVLRRTPTRVAACAPKGVLEALGAAPASLVELRPFSMRADEIEELRLEAGGRTLEIARKGTGFHLREPEDRDLGPAEAEAATELLSRIASSKAERASRHEGAPFVSAGRARIRSGEHDEVVELGSGVEVSLRRALDGAELTVDRSILRLLTPRATSFAPLRLLDEKRRVVRVVLRCGMPQEIVDEGRGFELAVPKGLPADGSITQLVDALVRGKVDLWIADTRDGFALGEDACRVVLGFDDGNLPVTVRFDGDGDGGIYGSVDGADRVFVANTGLRELAQRIYVSRAGLRVAQNEIASVRVSQGTAKKPVTAVDAEALAAAASSLFADRVVSVGKRAAPEADLTIDITRADAGAAKHVVCGPAKGAKEGKRLCTASDLPDVTYEVADSKLAPFLTLARDSGAH